MNRVDRRAGDWRRVIQECLKRVHGTVVLISVTQGSDFDNATFGKRWRAINSRIRAQLAREGLRPPRAVVRVPQLQQRGAVHLHLVYLSRSPDEAERVRRYVALYDRWKAEYGLGWIDDPYRMRRPRVNGRPDLSRPARNMVFDRAERVAAYLAPYLASGQFGSYLESVAEGELNSRVWISPTLMRLSGWSLETCRIVRQGWLIVNGRWRLHRPAWDRSPRTYPGWWRDPGQRSWVLAVLGSPG